MEWPWKKKKTSFSDAAKFNWESDTNSELRQKLDELARSYTKLSEKEYRKKLLMVFREHGLDIDADQLDMLLLLRQKTDQMLLKQEADNDKENNMKEE